MYDKVKFLIASDTSICVEFGNEISKEINDKIRAFEDMLKDYPIEGIEETVPTYRSVLVHYNPGIVTFSELAEKLREIIEKSGNAHASEGELIRVPVCYGGEYGPDLEYVAEYHNMTAEEVIDIHT
ncbi:MAG: carboxyltransferase domain-containing protein, partial [Christensenellaceae bacterium]|nr:carboxyltransferase domain-containing protein [Christensenellaceae bacterium]